VGPFEEATVPSPRDVASDTTPGDLTATPLPVGPERLRKRADFAEVMRKGRRARHPLLQLVALRTDSNTTRVGFSVSKQVGGAVIRNRVKRRLRMIVRGLDWVPGVDLVIVARSGADSVSYGELTSIVSQNARKLRLLSGVDA